MKPQDVAQYRKAGRGFLVTRNSATLADTDYEHVAKEIVSALNDRKRLVEALKDAIATTPPESAFLQSRVALLRELGEIE